MSKYICVLSHLCISIPATASFNRVVFFYNLPPRPILAAPGVKINSISFIFPNHIYPKTSRCAALECTWHYRFPIIDFSMKLLLKLQTGMACQFYSTWQRAKICQRPCKSLRTFRSCSNQRPSRSAILNKKLQLAGRRKVGVL